MRPSSSTDVHMRKSVLIVVTCAAVCAVAIARADEPMSDDAVKEKIIRFVTLPSRMCGHPLVDFREEFRSRKLTNREWFDGDTNRLARLIAEIAETNDVDLASQMIESLGEYGTAAQLPFLYSCATNPVLGKVAVNAVLSIEGVTSNSVEMVNNFLFQTNFFPFPNIGDRADVCAGLLDKVYSNAILSECRSNVWEMAWRFERDVNLVPNTIDTKFSELDQLYRYSSRRLSLLRTIRQRLDSEFVAITNSNYEVERRLCCYEFQTNHIVTAINELVAYPEANLPD